MGIIFSQGGCSVCTLMRRRNGYSNKKALNLSLRENSFLIYFLKDMMYDFSFGCEADVAEMVRFKNKTW